MLYANLQKGFTYIPNGLKFGVIIKQSSCDQRHSGFFFINHLDNDQIYKLHLLDGLKAGNFNEKDLKDYAYTWFENLRPTRVRPIVTKLALLAEKIIKNGDDTPFGFIYSGKAYYNDQNAFVPGLLGDSLTCATFITCLLQQNGINLVDNSSWPILSDDIEWKYTHFSYMEMVGYTKQFIQAQEKFIDCYPRIKPEHVVGATLVFNSSSPCVYQDVLKPSEHVLKELIRLT